MSTVLIPMPHLNRPPPPPPSHSGQVCCISLKDDDLIRLFATPQSLVMAIKTSIEHTYNNRNAVKYSNENNRTFHELKVIGDPWNANQDDADRGRLALISIIRTMAVNGWNLLQAIDVIKKGNEKASESMFFQRIDPRLGAVTPHEADMFGMWFHSSDSLRIITASAVAFIPNIRQVILSGWRLGMKKEQITGGVTHEFVLKGNPWSPSDRESIAVALLLSHIMAYVKSQGFKLYTSVNLNKGDRNSDFWVFRRVGRCWS